MPFSNYFRASQRDIRAPRKNTHKVIQRNTERKNKSSRPFVDDFHSFCASLTATLRHEAPHRFRQCARRCSRFGAWMDYNKSAMKFRSLARADCFNGYLCDGDGQDGDDARDPRKNVYTPPMK